MDFAGFDGTFDDSATQGEIVAEDDDELGTFLSALDEALDGTFTAADITDLLELSRLASALPTELLEKWERCNGSTTGFVKALAEGERGLFPDAAGRGGYEQVSLAEWVMYNAVRGHHHRRHEQTKSGQHPARGARTRWRR